MVGIDSDFEKLAKVKTVTGAQLLYLHFEDLQDQCIIIGFPKADAELIAKMRGKMEGPAFTNFNFTTKLADAEANIQPVVRFDGDPPPAVNVNPPLTWIKFGQYLDTLANETSLQASQTTVLSQGQQVSFDGEDLESRAGFAEQQADVSSLSSIYYPQHQQQFQQRGRGFIRGGLRGGGRFQFPRGPSAGSTSMWTQPYPAPQTMIMEPPTQQPFFHGYPPQYIPGYGQPGRGAFGVQQPQQARGTPARGMPGRGMSSVGRFQQSGRGVPAPQMGQMGYQHPPAPPRRPQQQVYPPQQYQQYPQQHVYSHPQQFPQYQSFQAEEEFHCGPFEEAEEHQVVSARR